jgi:hypothetical protein
LAAGTSAPLRSTGATAGALNLAGARVADFTSTCAARGSVSAGAAATTRCDDYAVRELIAVFAHVGSASAAITVSWTQPTAVKAPFAAAALAKEPLSADEQRELFARLYRDYRRDAATQTTLAGGATAPARRTVCFNGNFLHVPRNRKVLLLAGVTEYFLVRVRVVGATLGISADDRRLRSAASGKQCNHRANADSVATKT